MFVYLGWYRIRGCVFVVSHPLLTPEKIATGRWAYALTGTQEIGERHEEHLHNPRQQLRQSAERVLSRVGAPRPYARFLCSCVFETHAHVFSLNWTAAEM
mgnify:CR=1 FL=1|jgi:hypothetical protein